MQRLTLALILLTLIALPSAAAPAASPSTDPAGAQPRPVILDVSDPSRPTVAGQKW